MEEGFDSISVRAFAKEIGKSHVWVLKLIKAGILPRNEDGTLPYKVALEAYYEDQKGKKPRGPLPGSKPKKAAREYAPPVDIEETTNVNSSLNKVKLAKETYTARLKELEYKARKGELLEKDVVCAEAEQLATALRGKLLAVPVRIAGLCEGRSTREIEEIMETAINDALKELQKCEFL